MAARYAYIKSVMKFQGLSCRWDTNGRRKSHTRTVVRECYKGDQASQWKRSKFDDSPHQKPLTDLHKHWQA